MLTKDNREYLLNLPFSYEFYMSGSLVRLFHASPSANNKAVLNVDNVETKLSMFYATDKTQTNNTADIVIYTYTSCLFR